MLSHYTNQTATTKKGDMADWDQYLPFMCMAYNTSVNAITGMTPYRTIFGRDCTLPIDAMIEPFTRENTSATEYANDVKLKLTHVWQLVQSRLAKHATDYEVKTSLGHGRLLTFITGDQVLMQRDSKLASHWKGP